MANEKITKFNLETKLTEANYSLWYFQMAILLESAGCTLLDPEGNSIFLEGNAESDTQLVAIVDSATTKHAIVTNCSESIKTQLQMHSKSATDMWRYLFSSYSGENYSRKMQGIKTITTLKYNGGNVAEFVDKALGVLHSTIIASGRDQISLTELCLALILNGLPSRFATVRSQLENEPSNFQKPGHVRSKIIEEEERQSLRNGGAALASTNFAAKRGRNFRPRHPGNRNPPEGAEICPCDRVKSECWTCTPSSHPRHLKCKDCGQNGHKSSSSSYCLKNNAPGVAGSLIPGDEWELPKPEITGRVNATKRLKAGDLRHGLMVSGVAKSNTSNEVYVIDSGCTQSILANKSRIENYSSCDIKMITADDGILQCVGQGDLIINSELTIRNVLHCPDVTMNLISSSQICDQGFTIHQTQENIMVRTGKRLVLRALRQGGLYSFSIHEKSNNRVLSLSGSKRTELAHRRTGHLNLQSLRLLSHLSEGLVLDHDPKVSCKICLQSKSTRASFAPSESHAHRLGQITHMDICHVGVPTIVGAHIMFLVLLDDAGRYTTLRLMSHKDDSNLMIIDYSKQIHTHTGRYPEILQCDGGGEFINNYLREFCQEHGIHIRTSTAYTPEQNSRAERLNRTILEGVSSMLLDCQLPLSFWGLAAEAFVYIKNRSPHAKLPRATPYEHWFKKVPDLTNLHVFGYPCFVHIAKEIRRTKGPGNKLLPKAERMIFVGYSPNKKAWRCYNPSTGTIKESIHVTFIDEENPINGPQATIPSLLDSLPAISGIAPNNNAQIDKSLGENEERDSASPTHSIAKPLDRTSENNISSNNDLDDIPSDLDDEIDNNDFEDIPSDLDEELVNNDLDDIPSDHDPESTIAHSTSVSEVFHHPTAGKWIMEDRPLKWATDNLPAKRQRTMRFNSDNHVAAVTKDATPKYVLEEPTFDQAMKSAQWPEWQQAINLEYTALKTHKVFSDPMTLPPGHKAIDTKMVLKLKEPEVIDGPRRYKARLCGKGFQQIFEINYYETSSPVTTYTTLRIFLALMAQLNYELHVIDVKTAFLIADLKEEVYIKIPNGYPEPHSPNQVLRLLKALYGLKQAPLGWNEELDQHLKQLGFKPTISDPCLYFRSTDQVFILVYVDDMILGTKTMEKMVKVKEMIFKKYDCHDKGPIEMYLNLKIERNRQMKSIYISHTTKIKNLKIENSSQTQVVFQL
jgi:hypothetical protein